MICSKKERKKRESFDGLLLRNDYKSNYNRTILSSFSTVILLFKARKFNHNLSKSAKKIF